MVFSDDARGQQSSGGAGQRPPVATGASEGSPAPIPASPPVVVVTGRGIHGHRRAGQWPPAVETTGAGEGGLASHPRPVLSGGGDGCGIQGRLKGGRRRWARDPRLQDGAPRGQGATRGLPPLPIASSMPATEEALGGADGECLLQGYV
jgi:hypothetical protein